jgi:hypothetical protein
MNFIQRQPGTPLVGNIRARQGAVQFNISTGTHIQVFAGIHRNEALGGQERDISQKAGDEKNDNPVVVFHTAAHLIKN